MNGIHNNPINTGNPTVLAIQQLAELVRVRINPELPFIEKPLPADDHAQRRPLIDLSIKGMGWRPTISPEHVLASTISLFRNCVSTSDEFVHKFL